MTIRHQYLDRLMELPALSSVTAEGLSEDKKFAIVDAASQICRLLMDDLGVKWKSHPVDEPLRRLTIEWIKTELEPQVGRVGQRFILSADAGVTYTERVFEGGDPETKLAMVKYVTTAIYLDDLIDKDASVAQQAEAFLFKALNGEQLGCVWLQQYKNASLELSSRMSDRIAGNMLLHSCTIFIEGCVHEYHIGKDPTEYFGTCNAATEQGLDHPESEMAKNGYDIPLPLDTDRMAGHLLPHQWPTWLREKSAVAETFAITTFRCPGGINMPSRLWVAAIPEMRTLIMLVNDLLSFSKELLADDAASYIAVVTKERRRIGVPGTALDGGWCLRDTFGEVYGKVVAAGARINRLLRPTPEARYDGDGVVRSISDLVTLLKHGAPPGINITQDASMKSLAMALWETHQKGYVSWHFQCPRYRTYELFPWVREMVGSEVTDPSWLVSHFSAC